MKQIFFSLLLIYSTFLFSQESIIDTIESDNLTIIADSDVDKIILEAENKCKNNIRKVDNNNIGYIPTKIRNPKNDLKPKSENPTKSTEPLTVVEKQKKIDVCFQRDKVDGVKIKVGITKKSEEANKLRIEVMRRFPHITTPEVKDVRPNYNILIGDYFTRKAAAKHFSEVKKVYPNAVLINWRVYCRKAVPNGR